MIDKKAKSALSLRLFGEDITVVAKDASKRREQAASATATAVAADAEGKDEPMGAEVEEDTPSS